MLSPGHKWNTPERPSLGRVIHIRTVEKANGAICGPAARGQRRARFAGAQLAAAAVSSQRFI